MRGLPAWLWILLVVAAVGTTFYCDGGANRPTHEGAVATVEALDFVYPSA